MKLSPLTSTCTTAARWLARGLVVPLSNTLELKHRLTVVYRGAIWSSAVVQCLHMFGGEETEFAAAYRSVPQSNFFGG